MAGHGSNFKYLESWSAELTARANRVRQLIGDRHWLTDGHHKEVIIREFLSRYTPSLIEIGSGFIKSLHNDLCSPEIDVLVSDPARHPALFNEGGIQILLPSSVTAYIEVKSTFSSTALSKALNAVSSTQIAMGDCADAVWRCICFCSVEPDLSSFANTVDKLILELSSNFNLSDIAKHLPTCITSFESYIVFIRVDTETSQIILNYFNFASLSIAVAFSDLFEHIRHSLGGTHVGELSNFITSLDNKGYLSRKLDIND